MSVRSGFNDSLSNSSSAWFSSSGLPKAKSAKTDGGKAGVRDGEQLTQAQRDWVKEGVSAAIDAFGGKVAQELEKLTEGQRVPR